jgi:hypothetical protein
MGGAQACCRTASSVLRSNQQCGGLLRLRFQRAAGNMPAAAGKMPALPHQFAFVLFKIDIFCLIIMHDHANGDASL